MHGSDADLAAHFSVIRHIGIRLFGLPIEQVFMPVPQEAYWDSIMLDIQNAREEILCAPVYTVLNLCRALAYRRDGSILSKAQGAAWGIAHLPPEYHPVIRAAAVQYGSAASTSWPNERTLTAFAEYMLETIQCT